MTDGLVRAFADDAASWSVGAVTTGELVRTACEALVNGLDSQALRQLAGAAADESRYEIEDLLERVGNDFGFAVHHRDSESGQLAAARLLAAQCVAGSVPPRELAAWMHSTIRHGHSDERIEALVSLDDQYGVVEYAGRSADDVDRDVLAAAARLTDADDLS